jgi:hypothetical protein
MRLSTTDGAAAMKYHVEATENSGRWLIVHTALSVTVEVVIGRKCAAMKRLNHSYR